jgi:hypothetical protein
VLDQFIVAGIVYVGFWENGAVEFILLIRGGNNYTVRQILFELEKQLFYEPRFSCL